MPKLIKGNNRQYFNIHTITTDIESQIRNKTYSSNVEMACLKCGYRFYSVIRYYVVCPICRAYRIGKWGINIRPCNLTDKEIREENKIRLEIRLKAT